MRFLLILMQEEAAWSSAAPGEGDRVYEAYLAVEERMKREGVYLDSIRLRFSKEVKSLRYSTDSVELVDGPLASTKEQMGGAYILQCPSIGHALDWAKQMPNYRHGGVEVRPIWD
jgi:hypothetical protein